MDNYYELINKNSKLSVIGLGYVGLPIAIEFAKKINVIGFDISNEKIEQYKTGIDSTKEIGDKVLKASNIDFTNDESKLYESCFHIIAVPTPVNKDNTPDLNPIKNASKIVGRNLSKNSIVVYESTVYPGVTEEVCIPILENESKLKCGIDFYVGYSPERINPGDKNHRLENIVKIVSGMDDNTLDIIDKVYKIVIKAGTFKASSIKVAEAAKIIENSQRDINIAFMNELSIIFNKMGIDTLEVLEAASTKWNFLNFFPGLVGGHCIGVDPYYLTYKAEQLGYHSQVILSGRKINDEMGAYIAQNLVKYLVKYKININTARVAILGFTFKENCPDTRNTKVFDIVKELTEFGINPIIVDSEADENQVRKEYNLRLNTFTDLTELDALIIAVGHNVFKDISKSVIDLMYKKNISQTKIIFDIKGIFNREIFEDSGYEYWRL